MARKRAALRESTRLCVLVEASDGEKEKKRACARGIRDMRGKEKECEESGRAKKESRGKRREGAEATQPHQLGLL